MQRFYLILIGSVLILSILFAILIWRQTVKVEKKAMIAKKAKEEYLHQLMLEQEEERRLAELKLQEELHQKLQAETEAEAEGENIQNMELDQEE